ncbi:MAG: DUF3825 domain-containing protein [Oscillospiraceae bacterium]
MLSTEKKIELYNCISKQFPDVGLYRISRVGEWLSTNGYTLEALGYSSFREFAEDFPEMFAFQDDNNDDFIETLKWNVGEDSMERSTEHPADGFFGTANIILNDDIIEMTQRSLYALTKIIGGNITVGQMKQEIYDKFNAAKDAGTLEFHGTRYTFPIGCSNDGFVVNGIITKNLSPVGRSLYFSFDKSNIQCPTSEIEYTETKPVEKPISFEDREKIYNLLTVNFDCEKRLHMAAVSKLLTDHGIDRLKYGYFKMKDFLAQLPFLELNEEVLGGVPQTMVTIHARPNSAPVRNAAPVGFSIPEGNLDEFCNIPAKPISILENYLKGRGITADFYSITRDLTDDFNTARAGGRIRVFEGKMIFPCRYLKDDSTNVEITLKTSTYEGKKWFLYFVDTIIRDKAHNSNPGKQLENFAFLGSWSSFLTELAAKAIDEEWDFANSSRKNYQILIQYIKYTFSRLMREKKVCISANREFAAFNTGLADDHYDDIYACFVPNDPLSGTPWKFAGFCTAASGGLGKQLVNCFNPLPQPPSYFNRNEDLFFDSTKQLHTDFEHIIIDNINRFPLQFLSDQFFDTPNASSIVNSLRICGSDHAKRSALYAELREIVIENNRLFIRIQNRLKDSIELAKKRVRWNYKTAVPSYFPKRDSMSLMLPLALLDESKPDVALVVELTRSGCYQGQTILTLPQAYIDARLLCRLTGDWLVPEKIVTAFEESTEYEI